MPFTVIRFKERNLQRRFWNCVRPYDGSFSKIGETVIWQISYSKGVNVFQNTLFKLQNKQSSCLSLKLNFSTKIDKPLFRFSVRSTIVFYLGPILSLNFSVMDYLKCYTSHELNPVTECVIFREKTST